MRYDFRDDEDATRVNFNKMHAEPAVALVYGYALCDVNRAAVAEVERRLVEDDEFRRFPVPAIAIMTAELQLPVPKRPPEEAQRHMGSSSAGSRDIQSFKWRACGLTE
jgi:hypothetical protein